MNDIKAGVKYIFYNMCSQFLISIIFYIYENYVVIYIRQYICLSFSIILL